MKTVTLLKGASNFPELLSLRTQIVATFVLMFGLSLALAAWPIALLSFSLLIYYEGLGTTVRFQTDSSGGLFVSRSFTLLGLPLEPTRYVKYRALFWHNDQERGVSGLSGVPATSDAILVLARVANAQRQICGERFGLFHVFDSPNQTVLPCLELLLQDSQRAVSMAVHARTLGEATLLKTGVFVSVIFTATWLVGPFTLPAWQSGMLGVLAVLFGVALFASPPWVGSTLSVHEEGLLVLISHPGVAAKGARRPVLLKRSIGHVSIERDSIEGVVLAFYPTRKAPAQLQALWHWRNLLGLLTLLRAADISLSVHPSVSLSLLWSSCKLTNSTHTDCISDE